MLIEMKVAGIILDPFSKVPIVILKDLNEKSILPIWIGFLEASAIDIKLHPERNTITRPMTHDLIKNILDTFDIKVSRVVVSDLKDGTFYAEIYMVKDGIEFVLDARPSDSFALALRTSSSIWVDEKVIQKSHKIDLSPEDQERLQKEKWAEILENLMPEDFGKYKM